MIAIVSLSSASLVKSVLNNNAIFQLLLGIVTFFMGSMLLYRILKKNKMSCSSNTSIPNKLTTSKFGLFGIGVLMTINPCAPILTLIALSANSTSLPHAIGMGISFGLGAVLVPFLFYGFFLSTFVRGLLKEFKSYAKIIEISASLLLMVVGVLVLKTYITL
jgi:cytochrome c biogenesis protein CcdA